MRIRFQRHRDLTMLTNEHWPPQRVIFSQNVYNVQVMARHTLGTLMNALHYPRAISVMDAFFSLSLS